MPGAMPEPEGAAAASSACVYCRPWTGAHLIWSRAGMEPAGFSLREPGRPSSKHVSPGIRGGTTIQHTGNIGFRIFSECPRPEASLVQQFAGLASSNLADAMGRFHFCDPGIRMRTGRPLCGVAVTVMARPADNLMVHKAMEIALPGDIIVVNTSGNTTSAVFGELMGTSAVAARLGGLVVDGAVRDVSALTGLGFPAFSRSVSAGGCDKDGPGEINVSIACGNTVVMPGDIVVGDQDGVVVVPREDAERVLALVRALMDREVRRVAEIRSGVVFKSEINDTLRAKGVI